jgi:hypothetical protein
MRPVQRSLEILTEIAPRNHVGHGLRIVRHRQRSMVCFSPRGRCEPGLAQEHAVGKIPVVLPILERQVVFASAQMIVRPLTVNGTADRGHLGRAEGMVIE